jgi:hypothetical protein
MIPKEREGLSFRVKGTTFPQGNDLIGPTSEFFSFGQRRFDPFVLKQGYQHVPEHQLSVLGMAT